MGICMVWNEAGSNTIKRKLTSVICFGLNLALLETTSRDSDTPDGQKGICISAVGIHRGEFREPMGDPTPCKQLKQKSNFYE